VSHRDIHHAHVGMLEAGQAMLLSP